MPPESIRLPKQTRDQLITLKRRTGLTQWNELCRWAFCRSLAEPTPPSEPATAQEGTGVEMTWKVWAGSEGDVYAALLERRLQADGLAGDEATAATQLRLHIQRGVSYMAGDPTLTDIARLVEPVRARHGANNT